MARQADKHVEWSADVQQDSSHPVIVYKTDTTIVATEHIIKAFNKNGYTIWQADVSPMYINNFALVVDQETGKVFASLQNKQENPDMFNIVKIDSVTGKIDYRLNDNNLSTVFDIKNNGVLVANNIQFDSKEISYKIGNVEMLEEDTGRLKWNITDDKLGKILSIDALQNQPDITLIIAQNKVRFVNSNSGELLADDIPNQDGFYMAHIEGKNSLPITNKVGAILFGKDNSIFKPIQIITAGLANSFDNYNDTYVLTYLDKIIVASDDTNITITSTDKKIRDAKLVNDKQVVVLYEGGEVRYYSFNKVNKTATLVLSQTCDDASILTKSHDSKYIVPSSNVSLCFMNMISKSIQQWMPNGTKTYIDDIVFDNDDEFNMTVFTNDSKEELMKIDIEE